MLVCMVSMVCCIWAIIWVNWSMLSWEAMNDNSSDDGLEFSEVNVAQTKGSEILNNLPDLWRVDPNELLVCNLSTRKTNGLGPTQTACHYNSEQTELLNIHKQPESELLNNRTLIEQGFLYLDDHETMERTPVLVG